MQQVHLGSVLHMRVCVVFITEHFAHNHLRLYDKWVYFIERQ